jgi:pyruvate/2-oxoglutarate dehydrogenase complex dihydrolipoamide acyltransferase (E2) component
VGGTAPGPGRRPHALSPRQRRLARLAAERDETGPAGETHNGGPARDAGRTRHAIAERVAQSWREIPHFAVQRGREGRLSSADLTAEPVASLSNLGSRGVDAFTGVIATGQRLLLTAGRVRPRPVAIEGGIGVRPTLIATLNVDHRSFDGDLAADVLATFDREFSTLRAWIEGDHR